MQDPSLGEQLPPSSQQEQQQQQAQQAQQNQNQQQQQQQGENNTQQNTQQRSSNQNSTSNSPALLGGNLAANAAAAVAPRQQDQGECLTNIWGVVIRIPVDVMGVEADSKITVSLPDGAQQQQQQTPLYSTTINMPCPPFCIDDTTAVQQYAIHKVHKTNPKVLCRDFYHTNTCAKGSRCDGMHIDRLYVQNMLNTARVTAIVVPQSVQQQQQQALTSSAADSKDNSGVLPPPAAAAASPEEGANNNNLQYKPVPSPNTYRIKVNDCCTLDGCIFSRLTLGNNHNPMSHTGKSCSNISNHNAWQLSTLGPVYVPELQLTVPLERLSITRGYLKSIRSASPQALAAAITNPNAGMIVTPSSPSPTLTAGLTSSAAASVASGSLGGNGVAVCNTFDSRPVPLCQAHIYNPNGCPNGKECQSLHVCRQLVLQVRKLQQEQSQMTQQLFQQNNQQQQNNMNSSSINRQQMFGNNNNNNNNNNNFSSSNNNNNDQQQQPQQFHHLPLVQPNNNNNNSNNRVNSQNSSPNFSSNPISMLVGK